MKLVKASIAVMVIWAAAPAGAFQAPVPPPPSGPPPRMGQDMQREYDLFELRKKGEGFDASKYQLDKTELKLLRDIEKKAKANKIAEAVAAARGNVAGQSVHRRAIIGRCMQEGRQR